jgi:hypothetical protein
MLTRVMALLATLTLALAVLFRSPSDYRMAVCIVASGAACALVIRCILTGRLGWALPFLGILGIFTPFHLGRFSHGFVSVVDMASLALFAASPLILGKAALDRHAAAKLVHGIIPSPKW